MSDIKNFGELPEQQLWSLCRSKRLLWPVVDKEKHEVVWDHDRDEPLTRIFPDLMRNHTEILYNQADLAAHKLLKQIAEILRSNYHVSPEDQAICDQYAKSKYSYGMADNLPMQRVLEEFDAAADPFLARKVELFHEWIRCRDYTSNLDSELRTQAFNQITVVSSSQKAIKYAKAMEKLLKHLGKLYHESSEGSEFAGGYEDKYNGLNLRDLKPIISDPDFMLVYASVHRFLETHMRKLLPDVLPPEQDQNQFNRGF